RTGFNFSTFFIKNPVTTLILLLILVVLGLASYTQLPPDLFPDIDFPVVIVETAYPGSAPAEVETLITKPIEDALSGLNGLDTLMSSSQDGLSTVVCQLQIGVNSKVAENDIRDRVSGIVYKLPKDARPPNYMTFDSSSMPIVYYTISGPMTTVALSTYAKDVIEPKLEGVEGVATAQLTGSLERDVEVALDPDRLASFNLSLLNVFSDVQAENYNLPGGVFDARPRQLSVRTMGKFTDAQALSHMPVATPGGGIVELGDLGTVRNSYKDPTTAAQLNGTAAIVVGILKQTGANTVATVKGVDDEIVRMAPSLPTGVRITKASDTSRFIKMSNDSVWEHLLIGSLLAVLVLFVFLRNWRVMIIAGLAIPLSIVMAFTPMKLWNFTFNNITMLALSLVVGILVDDAVVDLENIFRHMENGEPPIKAAINATGEIQLAVTATTMTIVAVFMPMSFMTGMVGQFMASFGLTVTFAVLFSLLIARTLTPMLAAYLLKVKPRSQHEAHPEGDLSGRYPRILRWCLRHRFVVMAVATLTFFGGLSLAPLIPASFSPNADRGEFFLRVVMPKGTPLEQTLATAHDIALQTKAYPGVDQVLTTIGGLSTDLSMATLDVLLVDKSQRKESDMQIAKKLRDAYAHVAGFRVMADQPSMAAGWSQKPVDVQILGDDLDLLRKYGDKVAAAMARSPLFADIETSLGDERSELRVIPDRVRMAQLGITSTQLAENLLLATTGDTPNTMTMGTDEVDVWVRLDAKHRRSLASLSDLPIMTARGPVPLSAIAHTEVVGGFSVIEHRNRERLVHIT
ncbi:MAG: efflux RND transporter permease subunit, partial [Cyanobacteria bacterium REEB65]|nr:efflux RND transporter permease subunit [Cyanobacteria bacterium REEB65]